MGFTSRDMYSEVVDLDMFQRVVRRSGGSYRDIADQATLELKRIARSEGRKRRDSDAVPVGVSYGLIGQLMTAKTRTTHELRAIAIERALGVTEGDLFVPRVLRGAGNSQPAA